MLKTKLCELMESNSYVSIYKDRDDLSAFGFGLVIACNDEHLVFASFSPRGENDGFQLAEVNSIHKIEYDDPYASNMKRLIQYYGSTHEACHFQQNFIVELLEHSKEKAFLVIIEICNSNHFDAIGMVDSIDDDGCKILLIDQYGKEAGYAEIRYSDITQIYSDDCDERYRRILYQM